MLQGACVYRDKYNNLTLKMYKEIENGFVLDVIYCNGIVKIKYIKSKLFTSIFPKDSIHIVYSLPNYDIDINNYFNVIKVIDKWKEYIIPILNNY